MKKLGTLVTGSRSAPFMGEEICDEAWRPPHGAIYLPVYVRITPADRIEVADEPLSDGWQGGVLYTTPARMAELGVTEEEARSILRQELEHFVKTL